MPRVPIYERSPFPEHTKCQWVLDALIQATENPGASRIVLPITDENHLRQLFRHEIISTLEKIRRENGAPFLVDTTPYLKMTETWKSGDEVLSKRTLSTEDIPIKLTIFEGFKNWRSAFLHSQRIKLSDLTPKNRQRIREVVSDIDEKFQLSSSPIIKIDWIPASSTRDADARRGALDFMKSKGAVKKYEFHHFGFGGGYIEVEINVEQFQLFKTELLKLPQDQPSSDTPEPKTTASEQKKEAPRPFQHLRWEALTIQFLDGNNARISAENIKTPATVHYKEMGFEDARDRKPNQQWEFLKLLAMRGGEFSWDDSEAKDILKKKKQLLSKTLRNHFGIKGDPFYPYKENNSYHIKINLTPESDSR